MRDPLTPEEILAKVAAETRRSRHEEEEEEEEEDPVVADNDDTVESEEGDEETPEDADSSRLRLDYTSPSEDPFSTKQYIDSEDLEDDKDEAVVPPTMQRSVRYTPAGAFRVQRGVDNRSVASTTNPPIQAVLVNGNSSSEETIQSIYTAEPMVSDILKDPLLRKRWTVILLAFCFLGMLTIISIAVYFSIDKFASSGSPSKPGPDSDADIKDRVFTHHALVFGSNARKCEEEASEDTEASLKLLIKCEYRHSAIIRQSNSDNVNCEPVPTSKSKDSISCSVSLQEFLIAPTKGYVSFDCSYNENPQPGWPTVSANIDVPSDCEGDTAFAQLVSICDDNVSADGSQQVAYYTSEATSCLDSTKRELTGGCLKQCDHDRNCDFKAMDYASCDGEPTPNRLNLTEVATIVAELQSNMTSEYFK